MQDYTLRITKATPKANALMDYLKTLDFIEITKTSDWWDDLSANNKDSIKQGMEDLDEGNIHSDKDVKKSIRQRILKVEQ